MEEDSFINILKSLADRVEEKHFDANKLRFLNRIDLKGFRQVQKEYSRDPSLCKKILSVEGILRTQTDYGPQFEAKLQTERAGPITVQTDDYSIFGGGGTALHPVSLILSGFCGCFSAAFAKWAAMSNIKLKELQIRTRADLDFTTPLGIENNIPIVEKFTIELIVESDASLDELQKISELTKERCFCHYCATNSILPKMVIKKEVNGKIVESQYISEKSQENTSRQLNRLNLKRFLETQQIFSENRSLCKRPLEVQGRWRLNVDYGPQFEILLETENAGEILVQTDETIILGGGGTSFHPVALCIAGYSSCISTDFARWAAIKGIELHNFKIKSRMMIDLTTGFGIAPDIPMIDDFIVELFVESDAPLSSLIDIIEAVKDYCICYYCYKTPIIPEVIITQKSAETTLTQPYITIEEKSKEYIHELTPLHINQIHNIKALIGRSLEMREL